MKFKDDMYLSVKIYVKRKFSMKSIYRVYYLVLTSGWSVLPPGHKKGGTFLTSDFYSQNTVLYKV